MSWDKCVAFQCTMLYNAICIYESYFILLLLKCKMERKCCVNARMYVIWNDIRTHAHTNWRSRKVHRQISVQVGDEQRSAPPHHLKSSFVFTFVTTHFVLCSILFVLSSFFLHIFFYFRLRYLFIYVCRMCRMCVWMRVLKNKRNQPNRCIQS